MAWFSCDILSQQILNMQTIGTASGSVASFSTDVTGNLINCNCQFAATQASGTPTPANPIAINGVSSIQVTDCGKNLFNGTIVNGRCPLDLKPNTKYTFTAKNLTSDNAYLFLQYSTDGENWELLERIINGTNEYVKTITTQVGVLYALWSNNNYTRVGNVQIELGETETTYEAYQGTTTIVNLGDTYYGGSVDTVTGKLTLTVGFFEFDGSDDEGWNKYTVNTNQTLWRTTIATRKSGNLSELGDVQSSCNRFKKSTNETTGRIDGTYSGSVLNFDVIYNDVSDLTAWKTWLANNPIQLAVELAEPIVVYASNAIELNTLLGVNNIYCDTGNTSVTYLETIKNHYGI